MLLLSKETTTTDFNHGAYQHYWSTLKQGRKFKIAEWVLHCRIKDYLFFQFQCFYTAIQLTCLHSGTLNNVFGCASVITVINYICCHIDKLQTFFAAGIQEIICTRTNRKLGDFCKDGFQTALENRCQFFFFSQYWLFFPSTTSDGLTPNLLRLSV